MSAGRKSESGKGRTLLFYMILIDLAGIILLTLFNYRFFYYKGVENFEENFARFRNHVSGEVLSDLDDSIRQAFFISEFYFTDMPVNHVLLAPQDRHIDSDPEAVLTLINELYKISGYQSSVYGIDIYYPDTDTVVTGSGKVHFNCSPEQVKEYLPWFSKLGGHRNSYVIPVGGNTYPESRDVLTYVKRLTSNRWSNDILVAIHVSSDFIDRVLNNPETDCIIITTASGDALYRTNDSQQFISLDVNNLSDAGSEIISLDNERYILTQYHSSSTGFVYSELAHLGVFSREYGANSRMLRIQFILSVLFNIIVLAGLSLINYWIYRRYLIRIYTKSGVIIREKTQSIDKTLNMLEEDMRNLSIKSKDADLLVTKSMIRKAALSDADIESDSLICMSFSGMMVQCYLLMSSDELTDRSKDIETAVKTQFGDSVDCYALQIARYQTVFLIFSAGTSLGSVFRQNGGAFEAVYTGNAFPAAGNGFRKSYKTAYEALQYRFLYPELNFIEYSGLDTEGRNRQGNHLKYLNILEMNLKERDEDAFISEFRNLRSYLINGYYTVYYCFSTLWDLVAMVHNFMLQNQLDSWSLFGYDIREYCKSINDIDEFESWMEKTVHEIFCAMDRVKDPSESDDDRALRLSSIIDENLENDISLTMVADKLGVRSDVLSKSFKDIMGKNFIEYVRERKLKRAVELLESEYNVNEISDLLGYRSPQYFIRLFREEYGMTPFQYRKRMLNLVSAKEEHDET